jgi:hypothetical protein
MEITLTDRQLKNFWRKVDVRGPDDCWEWQGATSGRGYGSHGVTGINGKFRTERTHRVSWVIHNGQITSGLCICHTCDNPPCVNPTHLFEGTLNDNIQDMHKKERDRCGVGSKQALAKVTEEIVLDMRYKYDNHISNQKQLSQEQGIAQNTVHYIVTRKNWRHI